MPYYCIEGATGADLADKMFAVVLGDNALGRKVFSKSTFNCVKIIMNHA